MILSILDSFSGLSEFLLELAKYILIVPAFILKIISFLFSLVTFIPKPFGYITYLFLPIFLGVFAIKLKGAMK